MSAELVRAIAGSCVALSLAIMAQWLARPVLRRAFGANLAYAAWAVVPIAAAAPLLPLPSVRLEPQAVAIPMQVTHETLQAMAQSSTAGPSIAAGIWGLGACVMLFFFVAQHLHCVRSLGPLVVRRGMATVTNATAAGVGPLLLGLWHPVIVLPQDFRQRHTARERILILSHERTHLRRGDPFANLACAVLQCIFWFNPLVHFAAQAFRVDQELGCDDLVLQQHPGLFRTYANAILKTQVCVQRSPLGCQWQPIHPLKGRIMQLTQTPSGIGRRRLGRAVVAGVVAAFGYGAWATQAGAPGASEAPMAATAPIYEIALAIQVDGRAIHPRVRTVAGVPATIEFGTQPKIWTIVVDLAPAADGQLMARHTIRYEGQTVSTPALLLSLGVPGGVRIGAADQRPAFDMKIGVSEWTAPK